MSKSIRPYMDWSGGLNTDKSPDYIEDNELMAADNVVLELRGALSSRKGCLPVNGVSYDAPVTQVFEWMRTAGDVRLMAVIDRVLCEIDEYTSVAGVLGVTPPPEPQVEPMKMFNMINQQNVNTVSEVQAVGRDKVAWAAFQDKLYFVDGYEYYVYDGNDCAPVTPGNGGEGIDLDPIKKCAFLLWNPRNYRFYAAGNPDDPGALYFSEPNAPDEWKTSSVMYPSRAEGPVTALTLFGHAMVVFFATGVWVWKGIDPEEDAVWHKIPVPYGTVAPDSIAMTPSSLTWLANGAIVSMSPAVLDFNIALMPSVDLVADLSANKVSSIVQGILHPETACAVFDVERGRYMLAYGDDPGGNSNNRVLVLDWNLQAYTRFTGWAVHDWCFTTTTRELLFGSDNYILVAEANAASLDINPVTGNEVAIDVRVETKRYNLDLPFFIKRCSKLFLAGQSAAGQAPTLDVIVKAIGLKGSTVYIPDVVFNEGMKWGDPWGSIWPSDDAMTVEAKARCQGERFQVSVRLKNPGGAMHLYGIAFLFRPKTKPRGVKHVGKTSENI